jgi:nicotinamide-nucleotide amidase
MSARRSTETLVRSLADALRARRWRIATAESCTGGLIGAACTELAGSSDWFERGVVSYSNQAKQDLLAVSAQDLTAHGAVSETVVRAMAEGALRASGVDLAVAVTGIAGPGGGSADKPVGTVWIGFGERGSNGTITTQATRHQLAGDRARVRAATVRLALQGLLERALRSP